MTASEEDLPINDNWRLRLGFSGYDRPPPSGQGSTDYLGRIYYGGQHLSQNTAVSAMLVGDRPALVRQHPL